jgi:DNA-binding transcriptional ArsR family regulator
VETNDEEVWGAFGGRKRRSIALLHSERPSPVGELAVALPVRRPAVSQHLKVLQDAGLVDEEAEGTRRRD